MADVDNEDPYGDDDLNDLPLSTINALEEHAFHATQNARQSSLSSVLGLDARGRHKNGLDHATSSQAPIRAPSDDGEYGSVEDGDYGDVVLDDNAQPYTGAADVPRHHDLGEMTQRELWRLNRFGGPGPLNQHALPPLKAPMNGRPQRSQGRGLPRPIEAPSQTAGPVEDGQDPMVIDSEETGLQTTANGSTELQAQINQVH